MKKVIKALWHGIKAVFTAIVDWVSTLFGMKDESKYSRIVRKIVSTAFAVVVVLYAAYLLYRFVDGICYEFDLCDREDVMLGAYVSETLSDNICYYEREYNIYGFIADSNDKVLLKQICWIAKPMEGDSLVCYSNGELRGYFDMRDGHVAVKPTYRFAWIFSDGLAAVFANGHVKFINTDGKVVIDRGFAYHESDDGYVFHQGHCAVNDSTGKHMGLIDRTGKWVLPPVYTRIVPQDTFWVLTMENQQAILTFDLDTVIPMTPAYLYIDDSVILATYADHTQGQYNLQGQLQATSQIRDVEQLMYDTRDVMYNNYRTSDEDGGFSDFSTLKVKKGVATCLRYEAELGWYGLMSSDGKMLTPPAYISIEAIGKDLYLCETDYGRGVVLNSRGKRVE